MLRTVRTRAIGRAASYGGGWLIGLTSAAVGVLVAEVALARRQIGLPTQLPHRVDGLYPPTDPSTPRTAGAPPVRLAVLGDSGAAGLGVDAPEETTGAVLAQGLADASGRTVQLAVYAVVGARTQDLDRQIDRAEPFAPQVVAIIVGANDVTHGVTPSASVRLLAAAVRRLRGAGVQVVVGTCPDLGTVQPLRPPLRWLARSWSRSLGAAQMVATVEAGGRAVALGDLLGPDFGREPDRYFGPDQFHPSAAGYRAVSMAMVPDLVESLSAPDHDDPASTADPGEDLAARAAETVDHPGGRLRLRLPVRRRSSAP